MTATGDGIRHWPIPAYFVIANGFRRALNRTRHGVGRLRSGGRIARFREALRTGAGQQEATQAAGIVADRPPL